MVLSHIKLGHLLRLISDAYGISINNKIFRNTQTGTQSDN
jgi:hypothetical protein